MGTRLLDLATGPRWSITVGRDRGQRQGDLKLTIGLCRRTDTWNNSEFDARLHVRLDHLANHDPLRTAHIATVGKIMATDEATAYPIMRKHDVDYLLVIFGGLIGYSG